MCGYQELPKVVNCQQSVSAKKAILASEKNRVWNSFEEQFRAGGPAGIYSKDKYSISIKVALKYFRGVARIQEKTAH